MGCGCNGGKPVNLRTPSLPPKVDPLAPDPPDKVVRKTLTRSDFLTAKIKALIARRKR